MQRFLILVAVSLSLGGCVSLTTAKAYEGSDQSDSQLAVVSQDCPPCLMSIAKDNRLYYDDTRDNNAAGKEVKTVKLLPGEYLISYGGHGEKNDVSLVLKAGHRYMIHGDAPTFAIWAWAYWIQDDTTREVVSGTRPWWAAGP